MKVITAIILFFTLSAYAAALEVATLNCYQLFSPRNHEKTGLKRVTMSETDYHAKLSNLAAIVAQAAPDVLALQEIGSRSEADDLARAIEAAWPDGGKWSTAFAQGLDTYTGQDVAILARENTARIISHGRVPALRNLSKHLVATIIEPTGKPHTLVAVHLLRPIGQSQEKHNAQLESLIAFSRDTEHPIIIAGDFNNTDSNLIPNLASSTHFLFKKSTHANGKAYDQIFARHLTKAATHRPPYGDKPNDRQRTLWTDHYLLIASISHP